MTCSTPSSSRREATPTVARTASPSSQPACSVRSSLDAHLVTAPAEQVPELLVDLVAYAGREDLDPIAQAAVSHAQFELIHPFPDGNGRVGRILVAQVAVLRTRWDAQLRALRGDRVLRSDSCAWDVLDLLPRHLLLTSGVVASALGQTQKAANAALQILAEAGVVTEYGTVPARGRGRTARLYLSTDLLALAGSNPLR